MKVTLNVQHGVEGEKKAKAKQPAKKSAPTPAPAPAPAPPRPVVREKSVPLPQAKQATAGKATAGTKAKKPSTPGKAGKPSSGKKPAAPANAQAKRSPGQQPALPGKPVAGPLPGNRGNLTASGPQAPLARKPGDPPTGAGQLTQVQSQPVGATMPKTPPKEPKPTAQTAAMRDRQSQVLKARQNRELAGQTNGAPRDVDAGSGFWPPLSPLL